MASYPPIPCPHVRPGAVSTNLEEGRMGKDAEYGPFLTSLKTQLDRIGAENVSVVTDRIGSVSIQLPRKSGEGKRATMIVRRAARSAATAAFVAIPDNAGNAGLLDLFTRTDGGKGLK